MKLQPGIWAERMLTLPEETLSGEARVTVHGRQEVMVEYYAGLTYFDATLAEVQTGRGAVRILGSNLVIRAMDRQRILIGGQISGVEYG